MKNFRLGGPVRANETIENYKYPRYCTRYENENNETVNGPAVQVVRWWWHGSVKFYRVQYHEFEILRVYHVKTRGESIEGKLLDTGYAKLSLD